MHTFFLDISEKPFTNISKRDIFNVTINEEVKYFTRKLAFLFIRFISSVARAFANKTEGSLCFFIKYLKAVIILSFISLY